MADSDFGGVAYDAGSTGRTLVLLEEGAGDRAIAALQDVAGLSVTSWVELAEAAVAIGTLDGLGVMFGQLGVAVVDAAPDQLEALGAAVSGDNPILALESERIVYAWRGYQVSTCGAFVMPRRRCHPMVLRDLPPAARCSKCGGASSR